MCSGCEPPEIKGGLENLEVVYFQGAELFGNFRGGYL